MSLKFEPASLPQHISVKWLILNSELFQFSTALNSRILRDVFRGAHAMYKCGGAQTEAPPTSAATALVSRPAIEHSGFELQGQDDVGFEL